MEHVLKSMWDVAMDLTEIVVLKVGIVFPAKTQALDVQLGLAGLGSTIVNALNRCKSVLSFCYSIKRGYVFKGNKAHSTSLRDYPKVCVNLLQ